LEVGRKPAEELYAFRKGRVTADLLYGIRQLIEMNWEYGKELAMMSVQQ
jgi:hypothetical protein